MVLLYVKLPSSRVAFYSKICFLLCFWSVQLRYGLKQHQVAPPVILRESSGSIFGKHYLKILIELAAEVYIIVYHIGRKLTLCHAAILRRVLPCNAMHSLRHIEHNFVLVHNCEKMIPLKRSFVFGRIIYSTTQKEFLFVGKNTIIATREGASH